MADVLTTTGDKIAVDLIRQTISCAPQYIRCATCDGTATAADTGLFAATAQTSVEPTVVGTDCSSGAILAYTGSITATGARGVTNAGSFTMSSSNGAGIFVHGNHSTVNLATNDILQYHIECSLT